MGRTRTAKAIAAGLEERIIFSEKKKKELILYLQKLKQKYLNKEISYSRYIEIIYKKTNGKTLKQWIEYYDDYTNNCKKLLKKQKRKILLNRSLVIFTSLFILTFIFSNLSLIPNLIGLIIQEQSQEFTQTLNIELEESTIYQWQIDNPGKLSSLKISGLAELEKNGQAQVYIDGLLILDTQKLPQSGAGITGAAIGANHKNKFLNFFKKIIGFFTLAGKAVEETPTDSGASDSGSPDSSNSEEGDSKEDSSPSQEEPSSSDETSSTSSPSPTPSNSEEIINREESPQEDSSPSQEEIPPSEKTINKTETNVTEEEIPENITTQENITEPETNVTEEEIPENITEEEKPKKGKPKETEEKERKTIAFTEICEETCDLSNLNLNKSSYTLRIEIKKSRLTINEIKYEILTEEFIETPKETPIKNITKIEKNLTANITIPANITTNISTKQYKAIVGKPTKWIKSIKIEDPNKATDLAVELPKEATNISVKTGLEVQQALNEIQEFNKTIESTNKKNLLSGVITGNVALDIKNEQGLITKFWNLIKRIRVTGNIIEEQNLQTNIVETETSKIIDLEEIVNETQATEIAVEYYTQGPKSFEQTTPTGKKVIVSGATELNYTEILTFTSIPEIFQVGQENQIKILWKEQNKFISFNAHDLDDNGKLDYIEWVTPHLSNQTFEIILITKAEHLDANKNFISNIYEEVKAQDNVWSETINNQDYVRVTFETNLTSNRDITLWPRTISGNPKIEVYEYNQSILIAEFTNLNDNQYNKVFLTNLISESQDTFDLKILNGDIQFDHIIDPAGVCSAGVCSFNDTHILEDVQIENDNALPPGKVGVQIKWNITELCDINPNSIDDANLSFYIQSIAGSVDNDVSTWLVTNQSWRESDTGTEVNAHTIQNNTNTTLSSITAGQRTNITITEFVREACDRNEENLTIRLEDQDYLIPSINDIENGIGMRMGDDQFFSDNLFLFSDKENGTIANRPRLVVTYTAGNLPPVVALSSPEDHTISSNSNYNFQCNVTDDSNISNTTINIWLENGTIFNSTINTSTGKSLNYTFNISGLTTNISYAWNCLSYDNDTSSSEASSNFTLNVTLAPEINLLTPTDGFISTSYSNTFVCNVSDKRGIVNVSFWTNWSNIWHEVEFNDSGLNEVNYTFTSDLRYDYQNQTDGNTSISGSGRGITTNGSDFWITDNLLDDIHQFNASWDEITNFSVNEDGATNPIGITTNGSDFWVLDDINNFVYHFNSSGDNQTDGFDISSAGSTAPTGIVTNGSDFWIVDNGDNFVYHFNNTGDNMSDGFKTSASGANAPKGITTNGSDFWVTDSGSDFVYHFNSSGDNQTNGFNIGKAGANAPKGITSDREINFGFINNFYFYDFDDLFVYHFASTNDGEYSWQCQACGAMGACNTSVANFTLNISVKNFLPTHSAPVFSPSNPKRSDNLTCINQSTSDLNNDNVTNTYNWLVNGESIAVLNLPFDTNKTADQDIIRDYSGRENNATLNDSNNNNWINNCIKGGCYSFDGTGGSGNWDYITVPDNESLGKDLTNYTISLWIRRTGSWTSDAEGIAAKRNQTTTTELFSLEGELNGASTHRVKGNMYNSSGSAFNIYTTALNESVWYHLALVYEDTSKNMSIYLNGSIQDSIIVTGGISQAQREATPFYIGRLDSASTARELDGDIDEFLLFNRSLSSQQIKQISLEGFENYTNNTISSEETKNAENWTCQVTPNDITGDGITKQNSTLINRPPTIPFVASISNVNPVEGGETSTTFVITLDDEDGAEDLNNNSVTANYTRAGEAQRNDTCSVIVGQSTATSNNYTCTIGLQYFDGSGVWSVNVYGEDISGSSGLNTSRSFVYQQLKALVISPSGITFNVTIGNTNTTGNENTLINNTGNYNATGKVTIQGINLLNNPFVLDVGNFTASVNSGVSSCAGNFLQNATYVNITGSVLEKGNVSASQGQENIYYCLTDVQPVIPSGVYDTSTAGSWTILLELTAISFRRRKKKLKKDNKLIKALKILTSELKDAYTKEKEVIINLLIKEIKKKYRLNTKEILELIRVRKEISIPVTIFSSKLGALESIIKYLKENMNMKYTEIAELLNRNERTIWTAYKKAIQKQPKPLKTNKKEMKLPIKIFENKKLTILESAIKYLKEKELKYSEIAKLLERDQRNIRTIYQRLMNKIKKSL